LPFDKIFILGAGAIGSVYGALLSRKNEVTLIGNKAHVKTINSQGLSIVGDINETFRLKADTKIHDIPNKTLVILTIKAYDTARALEGIRSLLKNDTVILILQNGFGNEGVVRDVVGSKYRILRGVTTMAAELSNLGEVKYWKGETIIGQDRVAREIVKMFKACKLETRFSDGIDSDVWIKLVVNCVVNPLTAILRVTDGAIVVDSLKAVRHEIVKECAKVAEAEGITLPADLMQRIDEQVAHYTNFSSMYQDIVKGKKTEIDFLNGKIVELGAKHHIPTPVNTTLVCFIKFLEGKNGISKHD
jgi:2-dehydropantoate 2-reductase